MIDWLCLHRERLARALFGLFLVIQCSAIVFRHAHRLSNGTIVVHTHPYNPFCKGPFQPNEHTSNELYWLAATANLPYEDTPIFQFVFAVPFTYVTPVFRQPRQNTITLPFFCYGQRGPPSRLPFLI